MNQIKWRVFSIVIALAVVGCSENKSEEQKSAPSKKESKQAEARNNSLALAGNIQGVAQTTYVGACVEAVGSVFTRTNQQGIQESCTVLSQSVVNGHCHQNLSCVPVIAPDEIDTRGLCASNSQGGVLGGPLNCIGD